MGPESLWAAEASECAAEQDAFWEFHDLLYENQSGAEFSKDNLKLFAETLGLDQETFDQCLDSGKYTAVVQQEVELSRQLDVQSTPVFLINGVQIIGAQPYESFEQVIESLLAADSSQ